MYFTLSSSEFFFFNDVMWDLWVVGLTFRNLCSVIRRIVDPLRPRQGTGNFLTSVRASALVLNGQAMSYAYQVSDWHFVVGWIHYPACSSRPVCRAGACLAQQGVGHRRHSQGEAGLTNARFVGQVEFRSNVIRQLGLERFLRALYRFRTNFYLADGPCFRHFGSRYLRVDRLQNRVYSGVAIGLFSRFSDGDLLPDVYARDDRLDKVLPIGDTMVCGRSSCANDSSQGVFHAKRGLSVGSRIDHVRCVREGHYHVYRRQCSNLVYCINGDLRVNRFRLQVNGGFRGGHADVSVGLLLRFFKAYRIARTCFCPGDFRYAFRR